MNFSGVLVPGDVCVWDWLPIGYLSRVWRLLGCEINSRGRNLEPAGCFPARFPEKVGGWSCRRCFPPLQDVRYYSEECEVDLRDPIKDYELYRETCQELQRLMAEIQELKSRGIKDNVRRGLGA